MGLALQAAADMLTAQQQTQRLLMMGRQMRRDAAEPGAAPIPGQMKAMLHYGLMVQEVERSRTGLILAGIAAANEVATEPEPTAA